MIDFNIGLNITHAAMACEDPTTIVVNGIKGTPVADEEEKKMIMQFIGDDINPSPSPPPAVQDQAPWSTYISPAPIVIQKGGGGGILKKAVSFSPTSSSPSPIGDLAQHKIHIVKPCQFCCMDMNIEENVLHGKCKKCFVKSTASKNGWTVKDTEERMGLRKSTYETASCVGGSCGS